MTFTVLGARGFIGRALTAQLRASGHDVLALDRDEDLDRPLGRVVDCTGVTADFRERPLDAVEAHVGRVVDLFRAARIDSYLYLSSTRVYRRCTNTSEDEEIRVRPADPDDLYAISKLGGESLVLTVGGDRARVARISNVVGLDLVGSTFLASVIRDAVLVGHVDVGVSPDSERDFVALGDVVVALEAIVERGRHRIYNVASGINVSVQRVLDEVARLTGASYRFSPEARHVAFPVIEVARVRDDLGFQPSDPLSHLPDLVAAARKELQGQ